MICHSTIISVHSPLLPSRCVSLRKAKKGSSMSSNTRRRSTPERPSSRRGATGQQVPSPLCRCLARRARLNGILLSAQPPSQARPDRAAQHSDCGSGHTPCSAVGPAPRSRRNFVTARSLSRQIPTGARSSSSIVRHHSQPLNALRGIYCW